MLEEVQQGIEAFKEAMDRIRSGESEKEGDGKMSIRLQPFEAPGRKD